MRTYKKIMHIISITYLVCICCFFMTGCDLIDSVTETIGNTFKTCFLICFAGVAIIILICCAPFFMSLFKTVGSGAKLGATKLNEQNNKLKTKRQSLMDKQNGSSQDIIEDEQDSVDSEVDNIGNDIVGESLKFDK